MNSHCFYMFLLELQCERRHYSLQPKHIRRYDKHCALSMGKAWKGPTDGWLLLGSPTMLISPSQLENDLAAEACNLRQKIPRETAMGRCSKSMPPLQQHSTHSTAGTPPISPHTITRWCDVAITTSQDYHKHSSKPDEDRPIPKLCKCTCVAYGAWGLR